MFCALTQTRRMSFVWASKDSNYCGTLLSVSSISPAPNPPPEWSCCPTWRPLSLWREERRTGLLSTGDLETISRKAAEYVLEMLDSSLSLLSFVTWWGLNGLICHRKHWERGQHTLYQQSLRISHHYAYFSERWYQQKPTTRRGLFVPSSSFFCIIKLVFK